MHFHRALISIAFVFIILSAPALAQTNISSNDMLTALMKAETDVSEMHSYNVSIYSSRDMLLLAKRLYIGEEASFIQSQVELENVESRKAYLLSLSALFEETPIYEIELRNFSAAHHLTQKIAMQKEQAYYLLDSLAVYEESVQDCKKQKVDCSRAEGIFEEAQTSFDQERYDETELLIDNLEVALVETYSELTRAKGLVRLGKNFIERNWLWILLTLVILALVTRPVYERGRREWAHRKHITLTLELKLLTKMMKRAQEDCFKTKRISEATYKVRMERYRRRSAEIKHTLPVLKSIAKGEKQKKKKKA